MNLHAAECKPALAVRPKARARRLLALSLLSDESAIIARHGYPAIRRSAGAVSAVFTALHTDMATYIGNRLHICRLMLIKLRKDAFNKLRRAIGMTMPLA